MKLYHEYLKNLPKKSVRKSTEKQGFIKLFARDSDENYMTNSPNENMFLFRPFAIIRNPKSKMVPIPRIGWSNFWELQFTSYSITELWGCSYFKFTYHVNTSMNKFSSEPTPTLSLLPQYGKIHILKVLKKIFNVNLSFYLIFSPCLWYSSVFVFSHHLTCRDCAEQDWCWSEETQTGLCSDGVTWSSQELHPK